MKPYEAVAREFLAQKRIAVAGISRSGGDAGTLIYDKLESTGHEVFAVNPHTEEIAGRTCYPDLASIPGGVDAVVAVTTPEITEQIVVQCSETGVRRLWVHRSLGSSYSEKAVSLCREKGITVIPGGCPMMFQEPVDFGHKCLKWWFRATGSLPRELN